MLRNITLAVISAAALCAQAQLTGKFIFAEDDTVGVIEFDGKGTASGAEYKQLSGVAPFSGTYSIASDGSGSLSLSKQATDEDGNSAPTVFATYQFLQADPKGFSAMQTSRNAMSVARFAPIYAAKSISGSYSFESEGKSASGEARAEIGMVQFIADGNLAGKQFVKQSGVTELVSMTGAYAVEPDGLWTIRLFTPGAADEDGQASIVTTSLTAVVSSNGTIYALRRGTSQSGAVTFEPSR